MREPTPEMLAEAGADHKLLCRAFAAVIEELQPGAPLPPEAGPDLRAVAVVLAALTDLLAGFVALAIEAEPAGAERNIALTLDRLLSGIEANRAAYQNATEGDTE
jgi:hypothetical protein